MPAIESARLAAAIARHNRRIGTGAHRLVTKLFCVYVLGLIAYPLLRLLFRVRVEGRERVLAARGRAILAVRHFYEWDPLVTYYLTLCPRGFLRPQLYPISLGGSHWTKTRFWRFLSWISNVMGVVRGEGPTQGAIGRAASLLRQRAPVLFAIFPTGPVHRASTYAMRPGVGHLAGICPDIPVIPLSIVGIQDLRWGDVLRLRRPRLTFKFGDPLHGRDFAVADEEERAQAICARIAATWAGDEASIREALAERTAITLPAAAEEGPDPRPAAAVEDTLER